MAQTLNNLIVWMVPYFAQKQVGHFLKTEKENQLKKIQMNEQ